MNQGYFVEQELMYRADIYRQNIDPDQSDMKCDLQKEVEDNTKTDCLMKTLLTDIILQHLKINVGEYAHYECQGCRIDHPSQKYHDICLWTTPKEWIEDYHYHEPALECLNIYNVLKDFDNQMWTNLFGERRRTTSLKDMSDLTRGVQFLTPDETIQAYKCWQYFKNSQKELSEQWKTYWAKKLIESYEENNNTDPEQQIDTA